MARTSPMEDAGANDPAAKAAPARHRERVLSPAERLSEVLFGLVMALSITGALSVSGGGEADVRGMLAGAIGCNTAWGIVDALMYLMATLVERYRGRALLAAVRREREPERAHRVISDYLPPLLAASIRVRELEHVRQQLVGMEEMPRAGLTHRDLAGAVGVFLLVFLSTVPVVVPFLLPISAYQALRVSNGVALVLLFVVGWRLARYVACRPLAMGASMAGVGVALVGIVMALGG